MGHIYQIRNVITGAVYIGSILKRDPNDRWVRHRKDLRGNRHHSQHLQRAWNKYGEHNFVFEILEKVDGDVIPVEQKYLDIRKNKYHYNLNYNVCWAAGNCQGRVWSPEMRKKLSIAHLGHQQTPEAKQKQIESWKKKCKTSYSFTSPDGIIYNDIRNLREFARQHPELTARTLGLLYSEKIQYCNGWTKTGVVLPSYELTSPTGTIFRGMLLKQLCIEGRVNYKMIHKYCIKMNKPYKGWMAIKTS